jgi:hypothetical protein
VNFCRIRFFLLPVLALAGFSATNLLSQPLPGQPAPSSQPAPPAMSPEQVAQQNDLLVLDSAVCYKSKPKPSDSSNTADTPDTWTTLPADDCRLGKSIVLTFKNLEQWSRPGTGHNAQSLVLLLNGKQLKGVSPTVPTTGNVSQLKEQLQFELKRLDAVEGDLSVMENRATWNALMSNRLLRQQVSVGVVSNGYPPTVLKGFVNFTILPWYWPGVAFFMSALLIIFAILAKESDILRDGTAPVPAPNPWWKFGMGSGPKNSFSLARCQMAWWFFIILTSFLYIWMIFGDTETLTAGALTLMGISAATGFSSVILDSSKEDSRKSLTGEKADLIAQLANLTTALTATPADPSLILQQQQKQSRLTQVSKDLAALPSPVGRSEGFLNDILRDESGVSFHRFQMAAWTLVLGFVFLVAVYQKLAMPDFSATLLGLVGISSGTYIGFKIPNQAKSAEAPAA